MQGRRKRQSFGTRQQSAEATIIWSHVLVMRVNSNKQQQEKQNVKRDTVTIWLPHCYLTLYCANSTTAKGSYLNEVVVVNIWCLASKAAVHRSSSINSTEEAPTPYLRKKAQTAEQETRM